MHVLVKSGVFGFTSVEFSPKKSRLYGFVFWLNRFKELIFFDERKTAAAVGSCGIYTKPSTEKVQTIPDTV